MSDLVKQLRSVGGGIWGAASLTDEMLRQRAANRIEELEAQLAAPSEPKGWAGYVTVAEGRILKPSRHVPDGTYALINRDAWEKDAPAPSDDSEFQQGYTAGFARGHVAGMLAAAPEAPSESKSEQEPHNFSDWDYCTACGRHSDDVQALGVGCVKSA